jgi:hypothetical protein
MYKMTTVTLPNSAAQKCLPPLTVNEELNQLRREVAELKKLHAQETRNNLCASILKTSVVTIGVLALACLGLGIVESRSYRSYYRYWDRSWW